jgi:hypothetical protein
VLIGTELCLEKFLYRRVLSLLQSGARFTIADFILLISFSNHQKTLKPVKALMGIWVA